MGLLHTTAELSAVRPPSAELVGSPACIAEWAETRSVSMRGLHAFALGQVEGYRGQELR
jgi:hypothetical protein